MFYLYQQIVKNIAAIGLAIGIPNKALDMIQTARQKPPTPSPEEDQVFYVLNPFKRHERSLVTAESLQSGHLSYRDVRLNRFFCFLIRLHQSAFSKDCCAVRLIMLIALDHVRFFFEWSIDSVT